MGSAKTRINKERKIKTKVKMKKKNGHWLFGHYPWKEKERTLPVAFGYSQRE